jgi:nucleotide-binding universal stress UspA family protein/predicted transcriptional regulator
MAFPYRRVLSPTDFDDASITALETAAELARQNDGTVLLFHVVPMFLPPAGAPVYVDIYRGQEETARQKLDELTRRHLRGVKYEILTHMGEPAPAIVRAASRLAADVIVMATHGRRGFTRVFLGSVAEVVLREAPCPVLTVRTEHVTDKGRVGHWMTANPVTAAPAEKLAEIDARMRAGKFRSMPVVDEGCIVGIITERDLRNHTGLHEQTEVKTAMSGQVLTVGPETPIRDAARLLRERKIGALPVVEDARLVGVISTSDILQAFMEEEKR